MFLTYNEKTSVFGFLPNADIKQKDLTLCHWASVYVCMRARASVFQGRF